jgi:hypothetical protein
MLEWLTSATSLSILVSAAIFYIFGQYTGVKLGAKLAADFTIDSLAEQGYVKYRTLENGEIELIKIKED